jgi:putative DNA primase/helicase
VRCWNIGLVTGTPSGLVAIDIDPKHGGDETLAALEAEHGELPLTWRFLTGGGGEHILFAHPGGHVPCSCGNAEKPGKLGPGVDVKADGGYIVAPPSEHLSGRRYAISVDHHPEDISAAALPAWIIEKLGVGAAAGGRDWGEFAQRQITEGARNTELASLAGLLFRRLAWNAELAAELIVSWNTTHCAPPLDDIEVETIINSIANREAEHIRSRQRV